MKDGRLLITNLVTRTKQGQTVHTSEVNDNQARDRQEKNKISRYTGRMTGKRKKSTL